VKTRVGALVGPTAVGKSSVAVDVARRLDAEIVSVDSMQVYRNLDAGTDKPTAGMRAAVAHHLVDVVAPTHELTVAEYQRLGREAIEDIAHRGRYALLVGGSGLYFRAVVDDLRFPPRSEKRRRALEEEAARSGPRALHERLTQLDPQAAARIDPSNTRRVVRALEVVGSGGRFGNSDPWTSHKSIYDLRVAGLSRSRPELYERVAARVDRMLEQGLPDEARSLTEAGLSRTARQALGYRQVLEAPASTSIAELREAIVAATKRYVRRQESWFRADPRVVWFDASSPDLVDRLVEHLG
jgi:tRNA dimethylallyltransferase